MRNGKQQVPDNDETHSAGGSGFIRYPGIHQSAALQESHQPIRCLEPAGGQRTNRHGDSSGIRAVSVCVTRPLHLLVELRMDELLCFV